MIRVAEGVGGLALVLGLGGTLLSLWGAVGDELEAVDRVRILRAELDSAATMLASGGPHQPEPEGAEWQRARGLLDELTVTTSRLPLATRAVVLAEAKAVRTSFAALLDAVRWPEAHQAAAGRGPAEELARVRAALGGLQDELVAARRARIDRTVILQWSLVAVGLLLVAVVALLAHRVIAAHQQIETANEVLEERLRVRSREVRSLRGELAKTLESLHRAEERMSEAFAQATEAQRARAELEAQLGVVEERAASKPSAPGLLPAPGARGAHASARAEDSVAGDRGAPSPARSGSF